MSVVADTHALVWWVSQPKKLSSDALRALTKSGTVFVSAISVYEICVLTQKQRLQLGAPVGQWLADVRALPEVSIEPMTDEIAEMATQFGRKMSNDPADRIITATAVRLGAKLVSADSEITRCAEEAGIEVIW